MKIRNDIYRDILFLFLLSALMMARQLLSRAYFSAFIEDTFTYTSWASQFADSFKEGVLYPRWTPLNFWGYGSPTFILYPPLAFYLVTLFNILTGSIIISMNMAKFAALFFSGLGMFFLVREFYSERIALLSSSFYVIFPFNILQMYLLGTFSSTVSLMWFSPILLFIYRYINNGQRKHVIYAGVCYGGLILTHLINAYMFTFVMGLFTIFMLFQMKRWRALLAFPYAISVGVLVSAAYIFPVEHEMKFLDLKSFVGEGGGFKFSDFFVLPDLTSKLPSDHYWPVYYGTIVFYVFFLCLLMVFFLLQLLRLRLMIDKRHAYAVGFFFLAMSAGTIFLLFGISTVVWRTIPFFEYIQFPTRWLNVTVFGIVFLSSACFYVLSEFYKPGKRNYLISILLFLVCLLLDFRYIGCGPVFPEQKLMPVKAVNYATEHLPSMVDLSRIERNVGEEDRVSISNVKGKAQVVSWESAERIIEATADTPVVLRIKTFNFPGWTAHIDGKKTQIKTEEGTGAILVDVPKGAHTVELAFVDTPVRFYSKIISLLSLLALVSLVIFFNWKGEKAR